MFRDAVTVTVLVICLAVGWPTPLVAEFPDNFEQCRAGRLVGQNGWTQGQVLWGPAAPAPYAGDLAVAEGSGIDGSAGVASSGPGSRYLTAAKLLSTGPIDKVLLDPTAPRRASEFDWIWISVHPPLAVFIA